MTKHIRLNANGATVLSGDSAEDFAGFGYSTAEMNAKKEEVEMVMCGHCEKKITPNLIASWGNDHHDPDEMSCWDCFNGIIARAELATNGD